MKKNSIFWGLAVLLIALVLQSCATVFGGRHNTLVFTNPENIPAEVFVDDTLVGNAEGKIILPKRVLQHGSELEIRAEGYQTQSYLVMLKPHAGYVVLDFAFGAIPTYGGCCNR
jgi:hypothetical protein